jgi:DNA-binding beta-propeller fold protein YncE
MLSLRAVALSFVTMVAIPGWAETAKPLPLPDGAGGIGFDDLRWDPTSQRLLIPAGRTGNVDVIDPATLAVTPIAGFTKVAKYDSGHGQSVTSVDAGEGYLFATDRNALKLSVVDPSTHKIVHQVPLASAPDYVRYVAPTRELWVTEPGKKRIEVFSLSKATPPVPTHAAFIDTPGGPESLVVDGKRGRAYTHKWKDSTMAIDAKTRAIVATWSAGCSDPRGIWFDEARDVLLVGCEDGTATALDVAHDGRLLSTVKSGSGVDIIAYDAKRGHLYLPGDESATMAIIGLSTKGVLAILGVVPTVKDAHCVTTDERGHAYVCDPRGGRLLVVDDPYPAAKAP